MPTSKVSLDAYPTGICQENVTGADSLGPNPASRLLPHPSFHIGPDGSCRGAVVAAVLDLDEAALVAITYVLAERQELPGLALLGTA